MYIVQMSYLVEKIVVTLMLARDDRRRGQGEERTAGGVDSKEVNWRSGQLQPTRVDVNKKGSIYT